MIWIKFTLAVVLVEAVAEILTESRLTDALRRLPGALGYFFGCGYCASVWLGVAAAYLLRLEGVLAPLGALEPIVWGVVVHRASNVLHEGVSRFLHRVPWTLFLTVRGGVPVDVMLPAEVGAQPAVSEEVVEKSSVSLSSGPDSRFVVTNQGGATEISNG